MRAIARHSITWGALLAAAVALGTLAALPPSALDLGRPDEGIVDVRLAYHVHTRRSDGTGTRESIAASAKQAGIEVVILTDHGDGTRASDPPEYVDGVLLIDGAEISTWGGHYVAIGANRSPYPLGGEPSAVVEDVRRLGGFGVAAHPSSAKEALRWRAWDAPFDAIEWLNADSEWRDRPRALWRSVATYPWRPAESLAALIDEPTAELSAWDRLSATRPLVGLAAHDAHARLGIGGGGEPREGRVVLEAPSYTQAFRSFTNVVRLAAPLDRDPIRGTVAVLDALRSGHVYTVLTGLATPGRFDVSRGNGRAHRFVWGRRGAVRLGPHDHRCGRAARRHDAVGRAEVAASRKLPGAGCRGTRLLRLARAGPRFGCHEAHESVPWLIEQSDLRTASAGCGRTERNRDGDGSLFPVERSGDPEAWVSEVRPGSEATMRRSVEDEGRLTFRWRLGSEAAAMPYVAMRLDVDSSLASFDRLVLRADADRPVRVWVQVRSPGSGGQRWGRSALLRHARA